MKKIILCGLVATLSMGITQAQVILSVDQSIVVSADGTPTDVGSVDSGVSGNFAIRERSVVSETDRRVSSFFKYDVSSISVADTLTAGFEVIFTIEYVDRLDQMNAAPAILGRVVTADWDDTGDNNPFHAYGFDGNATVAADTQTLIPNIGTLAPSGQELTLDVTSIVTNWVNGTNDNFGFVLFIDVLQDQGAGFGTPELAVTVPEPSTLALFGVAAFGILFRRRRR